MQFLLGKYVIIPIRKPVITKKELHRSLQVWTKHKSNKRHARAWLLEASCNLDTLYQDVRSDSTC